MIAAAMFECFFLLPFIALGVIKDVGYRAGFLRDGLHRLQVLGARGHSYRGEGSSRGRRKHTTAVGLVRNGRLAIGMPIITVPWGLVFAFGVNWRRAFGSCQAGRRAAKQAGVANELRRRFKFLDVGFNVEVGARCEALDANATRARIAKRSAWQYVVSKKGLSKPGGNHGRRWQRGRRGQEDKCSKKQGVKRVVVPSGPCKAANLRRDFSEANALDLVVKGKAKGDRVIASAVGLSFVTSRNLVV